jgi:hypothetical protein
MIAAKGTIEGLPGSEGVEISQTGVKITKSTD